jgi:DNA mismatch endonuclease (patch repair protein)
LRRKDKFSKAKRSLIMSRIRSKNTRLDLAMRRILRKAGIRFKTYPKIYGNPDFLVSQKIVMFCDSGFWHGRHWKRLKAQLEKGSNAKYWVEHIARNRNRDRHVNAALRRRGFRVLRFWDDEIFKRQEACVRRIKAAIRLMSP